VRIILVEEMIVTLPVNQAIGIVHPVSVGQEVIPWSVLVVRKVVWQCVHESAPDMG